MNKLRGKYSPRNIPALKNTSDPSQLIFDNTVIANSLASQFSSVSSDDHYTPQFLSHKRNCEASPIQFDFSLTHEYNSPFTYGELSVALASCGSKAAGPDGISFLLLKNLPLIALEKLLEFYNSIWCRELIAILLCLQDILHHPALKFLIVSDSRSALSALNNPSFSNPPVAKVYSIWSELKSLNKDVSFLWCPSHCGISGNEIVDDAARNPSRPLNTPLKLCSPDDLKPFIKSLVKNDWQNSWGNVANNKLKTIKPLIEPWDTSNQEKRILEIVLTRMRIGHTRLTHNFLFSRSDPPTCECGVPLTAQHILSCPRFDNIRSSLPSPPSLDNSTDGGKCLFIYLQRARLFHLI
ncbi:hypothetical protein WDU94_012244 [Cyamophila willieti]